MNNYRFSFYQNLGMGSPYFEQADLSHPAIVHFAYLELRQSERAPTVASVERFEHHLLHYSKSMPHSWRTLQQAGAASAVRQH